MVFGVSPFTNWRPRSRGGAWESSEGNHAPSLSVKRPCEGTGRDHYCARWVDDGLALGKMSRQASQSTDHEKL